MVKMKCVSLQTFLFIIFFSFPVTNFVDFSWRELEISAKSSPGVHWSLLYSTLVFLLLKVRSLFFFLQWNLSFHLMQTFAKHLHIKSKHIKKTYPSAPLFKICFDWTGISQNKTKIKCFSFSLGFLHWQRNIFC